MQPTTDECVYDAQVRLGDPAGKRFKTADLFAFLQFALDDLNAAFRLNQLPAVQLIQSVDLAAGVVELDPQEEGILNFGELVRMEERTDGSTEQFTPVDVVSVLPQLTPGVQLGVATHQGNKFQFVGSTVDRELRLTFYGGGEGAIAGQTISIPHSKNYLGAKTAFYAGPPKGFVVEAQEALRAAEGTNPMPWGSGGYLFALVQAEVRAQQRNPIVPRPYRAGRR